MSWFKSEKKGKKHTDLSYQAQFVNPKLDRENPIIQQIISETGDLNQTWPNIQLDELKLLTEKLQQDVAITTGEVVRLGSITFLTPNPANPKKLIETGLTWENATVKVNMENFVIETVNQVLNDETTRLDDQVTYNELADALSEFLAASQDVASFKYGDMPELPSSDEYVNAVETNQMFDLLPQRLIVKEVKASNQNQQDQEEMPPVEEKTAAEVKAPAKQPTAHKAAAKPVPKQSVDNLTENQSVLAPVKNIATENNSVVIAELIKAFKVQPRFFKTKSVDPKQIVVPESDNYVDVMMARETLEANTFIQQAADKVADSYRETLSQNVADVREDTKPLNDLLATDWQTPVKDQIKQRHTKDYGERLDKSIQALDSDYKQAVADEEQRHEKTLTKLEKQLKRDKEKTTVKLTVDRDHIIQNEIAQIITTQKQYIEQEVQQLRYNRAEFKGHKVIDEIISDQKEANELLTNNYRSLANGLEERRQTFIKEHEQALVTRQASDEAQAEKERYKLENANVLNLEERRDHLEKMKLDLEGQVSQLQADASKWQFRAETAQEDLDRMKQQVADLNKQYEQRLKSDQIDLEKHQQLTQQARQAKLDKWLHPFKFRQQNTGESVGK
ncbi:hypothetical protein [Weissella paramesenteroides]|uniref:hypothetical protein n=1 Tax=Weissella paramesenteroides TaxID=1249 RepID=UPI001238AEA4|nr:hypothetical protein [Weissella paramesenteroides]KAA8455725.1 hypothetical protein FKV86_06775 [Weissella paramesenteroides]KAA8457574.1 hypothetical protein FKV78_05545 [Weissella paramesenteroides]KAA8461130.1 hypothetical protein FKV82_00580 [Weissella paramesenteroides]KAA8462127.1 hypothetical protein FKV80_05225 [Weissella paramesenteroides]KAA8465362.1 hypothetical protein FKV83_03055 [Weissella paramesenteroides]